MTKCIIPFLLFCQDLGPINPVVHKRNAEKQIFLPAKALANNVAGRGQGHTHIYIGHLFKGHTYDSISDFISNISTAKITA